MTKVQLAAAKKRLVALCVEFGKTTGRTKMVEEILTIGADDPDFAGPFKGDNGYYVQVLGYSFSVRAGGEKCSMFKLAVYELLQASEFNGKTYDVGYKSIKAVGVVVEQE